MRYGESTTYARWFRANRSRCQLVANRRRDAAHEHLTGLAGLALVAIIVFCGYGAAQAAPIIYTISSVGSGSLGSNSFNDASFTITATADTSQISLLSAGVFIVPDLSATISISGLGTATFTSATNFSNENTEAVGINSGPGALDILDVLNPVFETYNLSTSIGPVSGGTGGNPAQALQPQRAVSC